MSTEAPGRTPLTNQTLGEVLHLIGRAMIEAADILIGSTERTAIDKPPYPGQEMPLLHVRGPLTHTHRMRMQERVLGRLAAVGGSMSRDRFARYATTMAGYGRGYAQFYASGAAHGERLCALSEDRRTVTITDRGRRRLEYARQYLADLGETD